MLHRLALTFIFAALAWAASKDAMNVKEERDSGTIFTMENFSLGYHSDLSVQRAVLVASLFAKTFPYSDPMFKVLHEDDDMNSIKTHQDLVVMAFLSITKRMLRAGTSINAGCLDQEVMEELLGNIEHIVLDWTKADDAVEVLFGIIRLLLGQVGGDDDSKLVDIVKSIPAAISHPIQSNPISIELNEPNHEDRKWVCVVARNPINFLPDSAVIKNKLTGGALEYRVDTVVFESEAHEMIVSLGRNHEEGTWFFANPVFKPFDSPEAFVNEMLKSGDGTFKCSLVLLTRDQ